MELIANELEWLGCLRDDKWTPNEEKTMRVETFFFLPLLLAGGRISVPPGVIMPTRGKIRGKVTTKPEKPVAFDSLFGEIRANENEKRWLTTILAFCILICTSSHIYTSVYMHTRRHIHVNVWWYKCKFSWRQYVKQMAKNRPLSYADYSKDVNHGNGRKRWSKSCKSPLLFDSASCLRSWALTVRLIGNVRRLCMSHSFLKCTQRWGVAFTAPSRWSQRQADALAVFFKSISMSSLRRIPLKIGQFAPNPNTIKVFYGLKLSFSVNLIPPHSFCRAIRIKFPLKSWWHFENPSNQFRLISVT